MPELFYKNIPLADDRTVLEPCVGVFVVCGSWRYDGKSHNSYNQKKKLKKKFI